MWTFDLSEKYKYKFWNQYPVCVPFYFGNLGLVSSDKIRFVMKNPVNTFLNNGYVPSSHNYGYIWRKHAKTVCVSSYPVRVGYY